MAALWRLLGWPRVLILGATLALIVADYLFDLPALFGPEDQALHTTLIVGSVIFAGVVVLGVVIVLFVVIRMNAVVERNAKETLVRLERLEALSVSPTVERARRTLQARTRR